MNTVLKVDASTYTVSVNAGIPGATVFVDDIVVIVTGAIVLSNMTFETSLEIVNY